MGSKDGFFKVVGDGVTPSFNGLREGFAESELTATRRHSAISLSGGDGHGGFDQQNPHALQRNRTRLKLVTDAGGESGLVPHEESAVGTETAHALFHVFGRESEVVEFVQRSHGERRIAAPSAESCTGRQVLRQNDVGGRQGELFSHGAIDFHDEIVLFRPLDASPAEGEDSFDGAVALHLPSGHDGRQFKRVTPGHGIEQSFEVMKAIGALCHHVQSDIDFAVGEGEHGLRRVLKTYWNKERSKESIYVFNLIFRTLLNDIGIISRENPFASVIRPQN